jgi:hypothetical protein
MNFSEAARTETLNLLELLCSGDIDEHQLKRLEQLSIEHEEARDLYLEHVQIHRGLEWLFRDQPETNTAVEAPLAPSAPSTSPVLRSLTRCVGVLRRPVVWSSLTVALLFYGGFALISWNLREGEVRLGPDDHNFGVAVVSRSANVQWSPQATSKADSSSIFSGESLKIDSGTMELELKTGTKLVVEGPADWSVDGDNHVSLRIGKLMARVPKQAIGFTVETRTARIVDLGTEFTVEADEQGATEVQVHVGEIQLHPSGRTLSSQTPQPITLSAGSAVRVDAAQAAGPLVVRKIDTLSKRLNKPKGLNKPRQIMVGGALASSTYSGELNVNNLVNGNGLVGERHSATPGATMWHAEPGKIKGEYILFDLSRPYRLESMKVWNYNDPHVGRNHSRGVKQADIYVSKTSKGLPLEASGDWQLIAADVQFAPADGTSDYATPTIIPLGNVEARFAAIVIDEALGHDPSTDVDGVGLSEVQFFGVREIKHLEKER